MEAWKFAGNGVRKGFIILLEQIWAEGDIPKNWKTIIVPLYKRGEKEQVESYRGISLLCSAYKIYAEILRNRLEKETEDKRILPESRSGFRRGRSTIDNIFILNHLVQREKESGKGKKDKKVFAFFVDLKAAFDNVKREVLWTIMEKKGIDKRLISRIKKIYEEMILVIRCKDVCTDKFWIWKGVRQGCVLSPLLFNLYIADIDKEINKRGIEGLAVGGNRIWTIAYADDIVILAKNRVALLDMMDTLGRFLKNRELTLSAEKFKVLVFNKKDRKK